MLTVGLVGVLGLQLFMGEMNNRCYVLVGGVWTLDASDERLCGGEHSCGNGGRCYISHETPNHDVSNFNNIGNALLTIFIASTTEGWVDMMYFVQVSNTLSIDCTYFVSLQLVVF